MADESPQTANSITKDIVNLVLSLSMPVKTAVAVVGLSIIGLIGYYNISRKIENTEITSVGTTTVAYDTYATDYLHTSVDYKDIPKVHVTGHERCIAGEDLAGLIEGTQLKSISYSPSNGKCDNLEGLELK